MLRPLSDKEIAAKVADIRRMARYYLIAGLLALVVAAWLVGYLNGYFDGERAALNTKRNPHES